MVTVPLVVQPERSPLSKSWFAGGVPAVVGAAAKSLFWGGVPTLWLALSKSLFAGGVPTVLTAVSSVWLRGYAGRAPEPEAGGPLSRLWGAVPTLSTVRALGLPATSRRPRRAANASNRRKERGAADGIAGLLLNRIHCRPVPR